MADLAVIFISEAFLGDVLKMEGSMGEIAYSSFDFLCRISHKDTGKIVAEAKARWVTYDYAQKKAIVVPEEIKSMTELLRVRRRKRR
jgi:acyl-CoA thioesterase FadM